MPSCELEPSTEVARGSTAARGLELARLGHLRAHVERFSLVDAPRAYEALEAGTISGCAVIVPER